MGESGGGKARVKVPQDGTALASTEMDIGGFHSHAAEQGFFVSLDGQIR
jgi:hypothetical protein